MVQKMMLGGSWTNEPPETACRLGVTWISPNVSLTETDELQGGPTNTGYKWSYNPYNWSYNTTYNW